MHLEHMLIALQWTITIVLHMLALAALCLPTNDSPTAT